MCTPDSSEPFPRELRYAGTARYTRVTRACCSGISGKVQTMKKTVTKSRKFLGVAFASLALAAGFFATTTHDAKAACNWNSFDLKYYCR